MRPLLALSFLSGCHPSDPAPSWTDRMFVAVEREGAVAAVDATTGELVGKTSAAPDDADASNVYDVHNVQGSNDGRTVWATVMSSMGEGSGEMSMGESLVGFDADTLAVTRRIDLGEDLHVAHVVLHGATAYVTAYDGNEVLVVDTDAGVVDRTIPMPEGMGPHGARLTADGGTLLVAGMTDGSIALVDTATDAVSPIDLPGAAVQTAVLPDGSAGYATLYDTRQVARIDLLSRDVALFDLPADAAGPVQIYPSPDGAAVWVADQGVLDDRPTGHRLYELDAATGEVLLTAEVGDGPHGVVVDEDGSTVWTTLSVDGTLQAVDAATGDVTTTVDVGEGPNGVSCVHTGGSMP